MAKALLLIGTRPELIKCAPFIYEMKRRGLRKNLVVVNTGQHKELIRNTLQYLGIRADFTLNFMVPGQSLNELCSRALKQLQGLIFRLEKKSDKPSVILAQGDTATAFAAAMTAFHNQIPFAHIEAGLRTHDFANPFPEEYYRRIISLHAHMHFAPTARSAKNLAAEGVNVENISVTGNTIVDAIEFIQKMGLYKETSFLPAVLGDVKDLPNLVLVTCHRRENFGENLTKIIQTVKDLAVAHYDYTFVWIRHPNPAVKLAVDQSGLEQISNIRIIEPLDYFDMIQIMPHVKLFITDSGGIQEEAPSFKTPVIILREATERTESVENGFAFLCGADPEKITQAFERCLAEPLNITHNPYGDGLASKRIADYVSKVLNVQRKRNLKEQMTYAASCA